ncbi:hypothetical protein P3H15_33520 [Rhodococcus sp. T2V]|nr:hypothetical protein [Rhodococcus sp. T2V]MDF3309937.1 hypothetical protein [Rhodococcus sp. T2V]
MFYAEAFAQFHTFAVPSIGGLLGETGTYVRPAQKRVDDTSILSHSS